MCETEIVKNSIQRHISHDFLFWFYLAAEEIIPANSGNLTAENI